MVEYVKFLGLFQFWYKYVCVFICMLMHFQCLDFTADRGKSVRVTFKIFTGKSTGKIPIGEDGSTIFE